MSQSWKMKGWEEMNSHNFFILKMSHELNRPTSPICTPKAEMGMKIMGKSLETNLTPRPLLEGEGAKGGNPAKIFPNN